MAESFVELKDGDSLIRAAREDNRWLGVIDIYQHAPIRVTIEGVKRFKDVAFEKGRKENGLCLKFKGKTKMLILNAGNRTTLTELFGDDPAKLKGKEVVLEVQPLERTFNGKTHGIRIGKADG